MSKSMGLRSTKRVGGLLKEAALTPFSNGDCVVATGVLTEDAQGHFYGNSSIRTNRIVSVTYDEGEDVTTIETLNIVYYTSGNLLLKSLQK